tara:strand:- start:806 stop:985 length:180 start_codon:yes stop_codon:yes gene_type:complete
MEKAMTNKELIKTLNVNYTKKCIQLEKLKKENLELHKQLQAYQKMFLLEKDSKGEWIVL